MPAKTVPFESLSFMPRFEYGEMAQAVEVCGNATDFEFGAGFVRMSDADIPWQIRYDEVLLVLEGQVSVVTEAQTHILNPMDTLILPKGTKLRYQAQKALLFYAIHPANWAQTEGAS